MWDEPRSLKEISCLDGIKGTRPLKEIVDELDAEKEAADGADMDESLTSAEEENETTRRLSAYVEDSCAVRRGLRSMHISACMAVRDMFLQRHNHQRVVVLVNLFQRRGMRGRD